MKQLEPAKEGNTECRGRRKLTSNMEWVSTQCNAEIDFYWGQYDPRQTMEEDFPWQPMSVLRTLCCWYDLPFVTGRPFVFAGAKRVISLDVRSMLKMYKKYSLPLSVCVCVCVCVRVCVCFYMSAQPTSNNFKRNTSLTAQTGKSVPHPCP